MENKNICVACFSEIRAGYESPFCSDRCEISTHDNAPTTMIHRIWEQYKADKDLASKAKIEIDDAFDTNTITCKTCYKDLDYDYVDTRVEYFCSSKCVDHYVQLSDFSDNHVVFNTIVYKLDTTGKR